MYAVANQLEIQSKDSLANTNQISENTWTINAKASLVSISVKHSSWSIYPSLKCTLFTGKKIVCVVNAVPDALVLLRDGH